MNRIASLDFQRGLAVWLMIFLHVFNHIYDYCCVDTNNLFDGSVNFFLMGFLVLLAFLGGWAGYFIQIIEKNTPIRGIWMKILPISFLSI